MCCLVWCCIPLIQPLSQFYCRLRFTPEFHFLRDSVHRVFKIFLCQLLWELYHLFIFCPAIFMPGWTFYFPHNIFAVKRTCRGREHTSSSNTPVYLYLLSNFVFIFSCRSLVPVLYRFFMIWRTLPSIHIDWSIFINCLWLILSNVLA